MVVEALEEARAIHGFHIWAWVIMPEHVHVLLWPPFDLISPEPHCMKGRICGILSSIKRPVAEKAIAHLGDNAPDFLQAGWHRSTVAAVITHTRQEALS